MLEFKYMDLSELIASCKEADTLVPVELDGQTAFDLAADYLGAREARGSHVIGRNNTVRLYGLMRMYRLSWIRLCKTRVFMTVDKINRAIGAIAGDCLLPPVEGQAAFDALCSFFGLQTRGNQTTGADNFQKLCRLVQLMQYSLIRYRNASR